MRVLIVDDEALARLRLRALVEELAGLGEIELQALAEATDAIDALNQLQAAGDPGFDLLLLDIRMPGKGLNAGLRLAQELRSLPQPPAVVFVSAHGEHALTAFELDAVDYLTKPVRRDRLRAAMQRVQMRRGGSPGAAAAGAATTAAAALESPALVIQERGRVLRLPLPEVLYLKAEQKYVLLRTASQSHLLDDSLTELQARLAALGGPPFLRVHRNALVARHAVRALQKRELPGEQEAGEGWAVQVAPVDEWLAVSRRQVAALRTALLESQAGTDP